jgi:hypothetical protein
MDKTIAALKNRGVEDDRRQEACGGGASVASTQDW